MKTLDVSQASLRERPTLYRAGRVRGTREMIVHRNYIVFLSPKR